MLSAMLFAGRAMAASLQICNDNNTNEHLQHNAPDTGMTTDLKVEGPCAVGTGDYYFHNVNIINNGSLNFSDQQIGFYAENIIVENGGSLIAGSPSDPIGKSGGELTIYLWGAEGDPGALCKSDDHCGISDPIWNSNTYATNMDPKSCNPMDLTNGVKECFYPYVPIDAKDKGTDAYFGHKVLAVSYGGTLEMFGSKGAIFPGATTPCTESDPSCSGTSWARLDGDLTPGMETLKVDRVVDWKSGDHIVVTTTDYLPGHSEELEIVKKPVVDSENNTTTITFKNTNPNVTGIEWPHNGQSIDLSDTTYKDIKRLGLNITKADTRAAVGLLTRSIRIVSKGDTPSDPFPAPPKAGSDKPGYYFGGHTIVRQGFDKYQVQGVEFRDLGQGGEKMHYPVHFHMDRKVPPDTFVKDCSIWTSMTRWIVIHGTEGVLLARNVGYKSIGSGFYLEDGTETGNKLYSNLGVFARAAVANVQNPRSVPGILTANDPKCNGKISDRKNCLSGYSNFPFFVDADHPSDFWITNGMNQFEYNFAAGAGTCGACYWFVPAAISGPSREEKWFGYASEQRSIIPNPGHSYLGYDERAGTTPLESFVGNTCVAAMSSFQEVGNTSPCNGVNFYTDAPAGTTLRMLPSKQAQENFPQSQPTDGLHGPSRATDIYWPIVGGGGRLATRCPGVDDGNPDADCSNNTAAQLCGNTPQAQKNCDVTVLNKYTTSFNWAQKNFAAIWMRPFWSLIINSVITDPQNAGINFVTSGDYSKSSVPDGYWSLARKDVFIGSTQWQNSKNVTLEKNPYASNAGPFNPFSATIGNTDVKGLKCAPDPYSGTGINNSYCLSADQGISMQLEAYSDFQRLFSVYDGPSYQDSNAYLNIQPTYLTQDGTLTGTPLGGDQGCVPNPKHCEGHTDCNPCASVGIMGGGNYGIRADLKDKRCYLPNAAIGWKQSNGFYYSPAFHSTNLYFNDVPIRHFVIEPLFQPGLLDFNTDLKEARKEYCRWQDGMFNSFTDIDRETVLNDDDGSLTGLTSTLPSTEETISVNKESFFDAPSETPECASDLPLTGDAKCPPNTAKTSPYEYVTAAIFPECGLNPQRKLPFEACMKGSDVVWGRPCSSSPKGSPDQGCVGVPIYRQFLLPKEDPGLDQMKRMMGQSTFQRSALTVNHGVYYIDTTVSRHKQVEHHASSLNVFEGGQKYDLYFLYAKPDTTQTYEMFVGKDVPEDEDYCKQNVKFGYMDIDTASYTFKIASPAPNTEKGALPVGWSCHYTREKENGEKAGTLTLATNMESLKNDFDFSYDNLNSKPPGMLGKDRCKPATMCTWTKNQCACNPTSPYYDLCEQKNPQGQTICSWSVKDIDCPAQGCPAFQITFPAKFHAENQRKRPIPAQFDYANGGGGSPFNWEIGFNFPDSKISGENCHYTSAPPQCAVPPKASPHHKKHHQEQSRASWGMGY